MQTLLRDLRYAVRILRAKPGFTIAAILSLSLGIGACTAIFSIVDGVLLRSLPYRESDRIVHLREINERGNKIAVAEPNYVDVRDRSRSFESIAQFASGPVVVTGGKEATRVRTAWVSSEYFKVLGVQPMAGRSFLPEESKEGGAVAALVSYGYWQRYLGGRTDFNNLKINVDGPAFTVVGVMPPGFAYPRETEIWVPREVEGPQRSRTAHNWQVLGRIRPDVTLAQAQSDVSVIGKQIRRQFGSEVDVVDMALTPLQEYMTQSVRNGLLILLAAVALLMLVACANVANLLLAQATMRSTEFAIRGALGATRRRMAFQFITENLLIAVVAGAIGIVLAFWGVDLLLDLNAGGLPRTDEIAVNQRALLFTLGLAFLIAVALGFLPLLRFREASLQQNLKEGGRGQSASLTGNRLRSLLVVFQIALTLVLLVGAGLLGRSFYQLLRTDPGFRPGSVVAMTLSMPSTVDVSQEQRLLQFHQELLERLSRIPGVLALGGTNALPMSGRGANGIFLKDNNQATRGEANYRLASAGYFSAMGIPLFRGRLFNQTDSGNAPDAAVISKSLADRYWPNEDPIGRTIQFGNMDSDKQLLHIVGVVGDVREYGLDDQLGRTVYAHSLQRPQWWQVSNLTIVARTQGDPLKLTPAMRAETLALNPDIPINFRTVDQVISTSLDARRFSMTTLGAFALVALILAATGVYGVMSYAVSQRTAEIGVRIALGAQTGDVVRLIVGQGMTLALIGVGVGVLGAIASTRMISSLLHDLSAFDPLTFAVVSILLTAVAFLACWIPARRATTVDPIVALRRE
jgi:putative ABC transport system permease protein